MYFFIHELMKTRWSYLFFRTFATYFHIKLSEHGSNVNSIFLIMSELQFLFGTRVFKQNFNNVELVKFIGQNRNL
jgi:hypothetical protein